MSYFCFSTSLSKFGVKKNLIVLLWMQQSTDVIGFAYLVSELSLISFEVALFTGGGYVVGGKNIPVVLPIRPALLMSGLHTGCQS